MRFLKIYAYILIASSIGCVYTLYVSAYFEKRPWYYNYFGISMLIWYLITGIGILMRKMWGYYLFKLFLYVLLLGFPIMTYISYKSLQYTKKNNIKVLFGC